MSAEGRRPPTCRRIRRWCRPTTGTLRGTVAPDHRLFAGIPYAAPPVGPLRWQPPAPAPRLAGGARRHPHRTAMHAGSRQRPRIRTANRRGLPDPERVDTAAARRRRAAAGDGVDPRRRVHQRQRRHLRLALAGDPRRHRSSSPSTTGWARWASWRIRRSDRRATSATTASPISRRRCAGCATTSPTSAAIRAR